MNQTEWRHVQSLHRQADKPGLVVYDLRPQIEVSRAVTPVLVGMDFDRVLVVIYTHDSLFHVIRTSAHQPRAEARTVHSMVRTLRQHHMPQEHVSVDASHPGVAERLLREGFILRFGSGEPTGWRNAIPQHHAAGQSPASSAAAP